MINDFFAFFEIKQKLLFVHFHRSFLLNNQPFCVCYLSLIQKSHRFSLIDKRKKKSNISELLCMLHHKTTHEVVTLLHKQRWSSARLNIPFKTFEVTIYATLDTRRKNDVQFSSKNLSSWISRLQTIGME